MESSAIVRHNPQKYNKRVFPGSSSAYIEPEVIEVSPPSADQTSKSKARSLKRKEVVYHEIIDVDIDEDRNGVVFIEGKVQSNKKMKGSMGISQGPTNAQGSINSGQTTKKVDSNNKGKDIPMMSSTIGGIQMDSLGPADASNTATFYDLDDYIYEDDYSMALQLQSQFDNMDLPTGIEAQLPWFPDTFQMTKNNPDVQYPYPYPHATNTSKSLPFPQKIQHQNIPVNYIHSPQVVLPPHIPSMKVPYYPTSSSSFFQLPMNTGHGSHPVGVDPSFSMYHTGDISSDQVVSGSKTKSSSLTGSSSSMAKVVDDEDVLKRYESFKKFDTVVDFSDHFYGKQSSGMANPPKNWAKKIQDEWRILEKDLPDTIFVRAYESRMDLLRAVIIGAEGTPYHDGLFFFDVCFTSSYPNSPPLVHYHSGGLRINPNLYNCGKVCLSLLNTWTGGQKERWVPGTSTMLQVLVSIQGLILNTKPYFNEPGYAGTSGSVHGEKKSIQYNENTLILSLKTMVYTMRKPPKNFEDLVRGHFRNRVRDIMMACKAYTEGVQVGCLVRGGVQDLDEGSNAGCSDKFKGDVAVYVKSLVDAFKQIGAKEAEEFVWLTSRAPARAPSHAHAPAHGHGYPHISISAPALPPVLPPPTFSASVIPPTAYNHYW